MVEAYKRTITCSSSRAAPPQYFITCGVTSLPPLQAIATPATTLLMQCDSVVTRKCYFHKIYSFRNYKYNTVRGPKAVSSHSFLCTNIHYMIQHECGP